MYRQQPQEAPLFPDRHIRNIRPDLVRVLGPESTFSDIIAQRLFITGSEPEQEQYRIPHFEYHSNFLEIARDLSYDSQHSVGILPVENSVEGTIPEVIHILLRKRLEVIGAAVLKVELVLAGNGESVEAVERVYSYPRAHGQVQEFLSQRDFKIIATDSTSAAAEQVADMGEDVAAICSPRIARSLGLTVLKRDITDDPNNQTRFFIVKSREEDDSPTPAELRTNFSRDETAVALNIVKPISKNGVTHALAHMNDRGIDINDMGKQTKPSDPASGFETHLVEFEAAPAKLFVALTRRREEIASLINFDVIGIYAPGRVYEG